MASLRCAPLFREPRVAGAITPVPPRHASGTCVVIAYHVLLKSEPYGELDGAYFIERHQKEADQRRLVKQLESMGYDVALMEKAA